MRNLSVDPEKRTVVAQGGCLAGDIYRATEPHDLVFGIPLLLKLKQRIESQLDPRQRQLELVV
jgi:hypothetical protein